MIESSSNPRPFPDATVRQAYLLFRFGFTVAPIVAGRLSHNFD